MDKKPVNVLSSLPTKVCNFGKHTPLHVKATAADKNATESKDIKKVCACCKKESSTYCTECGVGLHIGEAKILPPV